MGGSPLIRLGAVTKRPVFHPEIGKFFADMRAAKGWSQRQAADIAKRRKIPHITSNVLWRLEGGKIKHPDAEVLQSIAALYELPYRDIAAWFVELQYGVALRDLPGHATDPQSGASTGAPDVPASVRRIAELEEKIAAYEDAFKDMQSALEGLVSIAGRLHEAGAPITRTERKRPAKRKTG